MSYTREVTQQWANALHVTTPLYYLEGQEHLVLQSIINMLI